MAWHAHGATFCNNVQQANMCPANSSSIAVAAVAGRQPGQEREKKSCRSRQAGRPWLLTWHAVRPAGTAPPSHEVLE